MKRINLTYSSMMNHHQDTYINNFTLFYGFQSLFSIELIKLNQSVLVQPAIIKVARLFAKWPSLLFTNIQKKFHQHTIPTYT